MCTTVFMTIGAPEPGKTTLEYKFSHAFPACKERKSTLNVKNQSELQYHDQYDTTGVCNMMKALFAHFVDHVISDPSSVM